MSWLTEFDDDGDEIQDPWKALDAFIERDGDYHVWIEMAKRLRAAAQILEAISQKCDGPEGTLAALTLMEIGLPPREPPCT